jgi:hypothetical protein
VEIKCQLDATDDFIADLIACSTYFGHHYAHHQELKSIIQLVAACGLWCLVFKLSVWCGAEGCVSDLRAAGEPAAHKIIYHARKSPWTSRRVEFEREGQTSDGWIE